MQIEFTWQTILTIATVIGAVIAIVSYVKKIFGWFQRQELQDKNIKEIQTEQAILTSGVLACLKGLVELGCDGVVKEQIENIESYLNEKAHKTN